MSKTFEITLNQAQRYLNTIKSSLSTEQLYTIIDFPYSAVELTEQDNTVNTSKLVDKALLYLSANKTKTDEYFGLYTDLFKLENVLFTGNTNSGLSAILSELKYLKEFKVKIQFLAAQLKNYASYTTCTNNDITDKLDLIAQNICVHKSSPQWDGTLTTPRVYLLTHDTNDYETMLTQITKQISELENKRDTLNTTCIMPIELSAKAQRLLGL